MQCFSLCTSPTDYWTILMIWYLILSVSAFALIIHLISVYFFVCLFVILHLHLSFLTVHTHWLAPPFCSLFYSPCFLPAEVLHQHASHIAYILYFLENMQAYLNSLNFWYFHSFHSSRRTVCVWRSLVNHVASIETIQTNMKA